MLQQSHKAVLIYVYRKGNFSNNLNPSKMKKLVLFMMVILMGAGISMQAQSPETRRQERREMQKLKGDRPERNPQMAKSERREKIREYRKLKRMAKADGKITRGEKRLLRKERRQIRRPE